MLLKSKKRLNLIALDAADGVPWQWGWLSGHRLCGAIALEWIMVHRPLASLAAFLGRPVRPSAGPGVLL